jgi:hypothetical protein
LRGPDYARDFSGTRVLFTGSSILTGPGVEEPRTIPGLLESELKKRRVGAVQVLNAGLEGFSSLQSAIVLPELLDAYRPGIILHWVTFAGATIRDAIYSQSMVVQDGYPAIIHSLPPTNFVYRYVLNHRRENFFLYRVFFTFDFFVRRAITTWGCKWKSKSELEAGECLAGGTVASLSAMQKLATARGIPFYAVYPGEGDRIFTDLTMNPIFWDPLAIAIEWITPDVPVHTDTLLRILQDKGIHVIHLSRYRQLPAEYFQPKDYHPNGKGAEVAARELADRLVPIVKKLAAKKR